MVSISMARDAAGVVSNGDGCQTVKRRQEDRILSALAIMAQLLEHDAVYLPVFLRLESELAKTRLQRSALERARSLAKSRR